MLLNPLYEVDALHALILVQGTSAFGVLPDFAVLAAATVAVIVGAKVYPRVVT